MSRVLRPARRIIGHFRDESFEAITCTDTDCCNAVLATGWVTEDHTDMMNSAARVVSNAWKSEVEWRFVAATA